MIILHTSDLHIGASLYGHDRSSDHRQMLQSLVEVAADCRPDAVVMSGDIFDVGNPSASSQALLSSALMRLRSVLSDDAKIILTAGNHDSPSRHQAFSPVFKELGIHTIGVVPTCIDDLGSIAAEAVVSLPGKGYVVAVPFIHRRNMPDCFFLSLMKYVDQLNTGRLPVVLMAHQSVDGADCTGHTVINDFSIGGIDAVDKSYFGEGYDYLALGHIHRPQTFSDGRRALRYCGSPLPVSFDEEYQHTISCVTITQHGEYPEIEEIPLHTGAPLVTIGGKMGLPWEDAYSKLEEVVGAEDAPPVGSYIRLNVAVDADHPFPPADASGKARMICDNAGLKFCIINAVRSEKSKDAVEQQTLTLSEMQNIPAVDLAEDYARRTNKVWTEDMRSLLEEITGLTMENDN